MPPLPATATATATAGLTSRSGVGPFSALRDRCLSRTHRNVTQVRNVRQQLKDCHFFFSRRAGENVIQIALLLRPGTPSEQLPYCTRVLADRRHVRGRRRPIARAACAVVPWLSYNSAGERAAILVCSSFCRPPKRQRCLSARIGGATCCVVALLYSNSMESVQNKKRP